MIKYGVWCEVWGGVTGSREGWLKSMGEIMVFTNRDNAEQEAEHHNKRTANNPRASFRYSAKPL